ncbi:MAG: nuclear transport factor 2 family protein [Rhodoferax sp.]|nr:nuclear transport factor 2 family protein [Rhodoferax sp.]MDZ7892790.1 nuclear transport factor 2 family protein [Rhodoferax sp.]
MNPIDQYFAADQSDPDAFTRCFTANAVVKDEGHTYTGLAAIQQWKTES